MSSETPESGSFRLPVDPAARREVVVIPTGNANLASVLEGLRRAGGEPVVREDVESIVGAEYLVLPGVGSFAASKARLQSRHLEVALRERVAAGRPTLGICLGMQLLFEASEENPGIPGIGCYPGTITRFQGDVKIPQLGWNRVVPEGPTRFLAEGEAYFANSYRLGSAPEGTECAVTDHGGRFVSAFEHGDVLACQFHPELSGRYGIELIGRWLGTLPGSPPREGKGTSTVGARVIPCLDVRDGRVVKGVKFQGLRDVGSPAELARAYELQGADELVLLDVSATPEGRRTAVDTIRSVRAELSIPLTVGGGVRSAEDAGRLLDAGADKVAINTAAVEHPTVVTEISDRFGRQCTVVSIDAARSRANENEFEIIIHSGSIRTSIDVPEWTLLAVALGAGELLLTSWDRDGTKDGYDVDLLAAVADKVDIPIIASGGASGPDHLLEGIRAGADAVLAASIFHEGEYDVATVKDHLEANGVRVRR